MNLIEARCLSGIYFIFLSFLFFFSLIPFACITVFGVSHGRMIYTVCRTLQALHGPHGLDSWTGDCMLDPTGLEYRLNYTLTGLQTQTTYRPTAYSLQASSPTEYSPSPPTPPISFDIGMLRQLQIEGQIVLPAGN